MFIENKGTVEVDFGRNNFFVWAVYTGFNGQHNWIVRIDYKDRSEYFDFFLGSGYKVGNKRIDLDVFFACIATDADVGETYRSSPNDFCDEFGYESVEGHKIWQACKHNRDKLRYLFRNRLNEFLDFAREEE